MHLTKIAAALLLPLAAVATEPLSTTTCTSYMTLTKTITLARAAVSTVSAKSNSTVVFSTPTASLKPAVTTGLPSTPTSGGSALAGAPVAFAAVAGVVVAAFL